MPSQILVATPDLAFGEVLRASLAENGGYTVHLVQTGGDVLTSAAATSFDLAILDAELSDEPFVPLARSLMAQLPDMRLLVVPPENNPQHTSLVGLTPHGYVFRPFYLPDLLDVVHSLLASRSTRRPEEAMTPLVVESAAQNKGMNWAEDAGRAQQQISRLLLQTSAQAALITFEGKVWASAERLGSAAVQEAADSLGRFWKEGQKLDLARYTRFKSTGMEHLIYATRLLDELVLALVYESAASLTRAHAETAKMAAALSSLALAPAISEPVPSPEVPAPAPAPEEIEEEEEALFGEEVPDLDLSVLLAGMPSPNPDGEPLFPANTDWVHENELPTEAEQEPYVFPWEQNPPAPAPSNNGKSHPVEIAPAHEEDPGQPDWFAVFQAGVDRDRQAEKPAVPAAPVIDEPPAAEPHDPISELRAESSQPLVPADPLERAAPATFGDVIYTCILLPNRPTHYLTGDLAAQLGQWIPQLCLAFGWRLEGLTVRPEYLLLAVRLAPGMSPGNVVRVLRQKTSERIFNQNPSLRSLGGNGDFWAPGYLVVRGAQPPSTEQLRDFIRKTRRRQGYPNE